MEDKMEGTHFYLLRTTTTQEDSVVDMLYQKVAMATEDTGVYAVLHPGTIKGYVFMEARDLGDAIQLVQGVPHTKGFVKGEVDFDKEVKPLLQPKSSVLDVKKGDMVELIAGPFKGEKAKVIRVDEAKEAVTVELIEATVPIPVTAKGMHIKVVDRVTQSKAEESRKKGQGEQKKGPVIGEGPLPPLPSNVAEKGEKGEESGEQKEKKAGKPDANSREPEGGEKGEQKEESEKGKPKKIVLGMGAEEDSSDKEKKK